ncbi:MAG: hypothetical protein U9Q29_07545 [Campylobacterota bacterium]|nr:hypothetical protein [Campylobacterota bacterium]
MKPLLSKDLKSFLERFDNFRDGELRHIEIISPSVITITLAGQDSARAFDWVSVMVEFSDVSDATLLDNTKLKLVDMSDGISLLHKENLFAFGVGVCESLSTLKSSTCQVVASSLKYQEGEF